MLGNIIDHRNDPTNPNIDAVFEPSINDDGRRAGGVRHFDYDYTVASGAYFAVTWQYHTTVRAAVMRAETEWPFEVTIYVYDLGSNPAG
jgi:hypothetical protein